MIGLPIFGYAGLIDRYAATIKTKVDDPLGYYSVREHVESGGYGANRNMIGGAQSYCLLVKDLIQDTFILPLS